MVTHVKDVFNYSWSVWMLWIDEALEHLDLELNAMVSLPNIDFITITTQAVYISSLESNKSMLKLLNCFKSTLAIPFPYFMYKVSLAHAWICQLATTAVSMKLGRNMMALSSQLHAECLQWNEARSHQIYLFSCSSQSGPMQHELVTICQRHILWVSPFIAVQAMQWSESLSCSLGKKGIQCHIL